MRADEVFRLAIVGYCYAVRRCTYKFHTTTWFCIGFNPAALG